MPETSQPAPLPQFISHLCAVGAIAGAALVLDATNPTGPLPVVLLAAAAVTRWREEVNKPKWHFASMIPNTALGLMMADVISVWI